MIKYFFEKNLINLITDGTITMSLGYVYNNQHLYKIYLDDKEIGYCDLRIGHNASLYYYGNIGYRIYEDYRGHNYSYYASLLLIEIAKRYEVDYLLITCDPDNYASKKVIEKLGFEFIREARVPLWHPLFKESKHKLIYKMDLM